MFQKSLSARTAVTTLSTLSTLGALLLLLPSLTFALTLTPENGQVEFRAIGRPSALKIVGKGTGPAGDLTLEGQPGTHVVQGTLTFKMSTLKTGIGLRDNHMKEKYLQIEKFPDAIFKLDRLKIENTGTIPFSGKLTLHGIEKPISGTTKITLKGDDYESESDFKIKVSDYGIDVPVYLGITVADEVDIKVIAMAMAKAMAKVKK